MLNETWLKKSVNDHEIIKDKKFSIFRNDRTQASHPSDPNNPKKFKKFGGGVLIAIRSDIQADIKRLSVRKGAEILAIEVSIDGKKFVFCTVYRVGNLDEPNHASIMSTIKTFYKIRNPRKIFIVGDFNLKSISWPRSEDMGNGNGTDKLFVDSFNGFGLDQCISGPTHNKGRTLDLMLTNSKNFVTEINVSPDCYLCKSDHYLLTFEVRSNVKRNKVPKRKILNFKKANWEALNNELGNINWDSILDCTEPELAWRPRSITMMNKFESFQKKCIKWILSEEEKSYSLEVYVSKCKQVNIPPLSFMFNFNDMNLFHKIVYKTIPVNIPDYLTLYSGDSRLRRTHLDNLSFVSNIATTTTSINNLNKSFFFRTHTLWNSLPFDIRNSMRLTQFKSKLAKHLWSIAGPDNEQPEHEWSFQSSDEGS